MTPVRSIEKEMTFLSSGNKKNSKLEVQKGA
jgi:hypothetical protein